MYNKDQYDELTKLLNRPTIQKTIDEEVRRAESKNMSFSIAYTDIDFFKKLNDSLGHRAGDQILQKFSEILKKNTRSKDVLARFGGDEFLFLLPEAEKEEALIMMEDIRRLVSSKEIQISNKENKKEVIAITSSTGIASFPRDGKTSRELLRNADNALLMAKKYGRNRVCLAMEEKMILKSNYYTKAQLDRLSKVAKQNDLTESFLLREALDLIVNKYENIIQNKIENLKKDKTTLTLDDISDLSSKSIQLIMKNIDNKSFLYSLLDMKKSIQNKFYENMTERAVKLVEKDKAEALVKKVSKKEITSAQNKLISLMNDLRKSGEI